MATKPKGVMIVGMDMPLFCDQCPCFWPNSFCGLKCRFVERNKNNLSVRPSWCPLQEVK